MGDMADYYTKDYGGPGPDDTPDPDGFAEERPVRKAEGGPRGLAPDTYEERGTEEQIGALYSALAKASGGFTEIIKNQNVVIEKRAGGSYDYDYARLVALIEATRPALSANGVFVNFPPSMRVADEGVCKLRLIIAGHGARLIFLHEFYKAPDIKDYGGQLTYLSRYMYRGSLGLDAGEQDADDLPRDREEGASSKSAPKQRTAPTPYNQPGQVSQPGKCPECLAVGGTHAPDCSRNPQRRQMTGRGTRPSEPPPPNNEPEVEDDPDVGLPDDIAAMTIEDVYEGIADACLTMKVGRAGASKLYEKLTGNPDRSQATESGHRLVLAELNRMRKERGL